MRVLVTGSDGQLGNTFKVEKGHEFNYNFVNKKQFNLLNSHQIIKNLNEIKPEIIINCAAFTDVDRCEKEKELAFKINFKSVEIISNWCLQNKVFLIHFSSDYVFDGNKSKPYTENDVPKPLSIYGQSKLLGEEAFLKSSVEGTCLRTSWVHSAYGKNFFLTMKRLFSENEIVSIVNDQFGTPTTTKFLVEKTEEIIKLKKNNKQIPKILHAVPSENTSWFGFGQLIYKNLKKFNKNKKIKCQKLLEISSLDFAQVAKRPKYSVLSNKKLSELLETNTASWIIEHNKLYEG